MNTMRFETGETQDGQPGPEGPHSEADILPAGAVPSGRGPGAIKGRRQEWDVASSIFADAPPRVHHR